MQIHCENCDTIIPAPNINIQEKLAVCPQCGSVFSFATHLTRKTQSRKLKRPPHFSVIEEENTLEIEFRLLRVLLVEEHWFTLLCGAGTALMGSLAVTMLSNPNSLIDGALGSIFALIALGCLYVVLVILLNRVRITVDESMVHARHYPLPFGSHHVNCADVVQVECAVASYNKDDPNSETVDYHVQLVLRDGSSVTLTTVRRHLAYYLAQTLEAYLSGDEISPDVNDDERWRSDESAESAQSLPYVSPSDDGARSDGHAVH